MHRSFLSHSIESSQHIEMLRHSSPCGSEQDLKVISSLQRSLCCLSLCAPEICQISMTFEHEYFAAVIRLGRVSALRHGYPAPFSLYANAQTIWLAWHLHSTTSR